MRKSLMIVGYAFALALGPACGAPPSDSVASTSGDLVDEASSPRGSSSAAAATPPKMEHEQKAATESPEKVLSGFCLFGCPPSPTFQIAYAGFSTFYFKVGPFPNGDQIFVGAWNGLTWTNGTTTTSVWTCPAGKVCPYWSYYASGAFMDPGWTCGTTEQVYAHDATVGTWVGPVAVTNLCIQ